MKDELIEKRKNISRFIIIVSILSVVFYYLVDSQWLFDTNFILHEFIGLVYQLFLYLIVMMILIWVYCLIYTISEITVRRMSIKKILTNIATTMMVILILGFHVTRFYGVNTSGVFEIEAKWRDGEQYYIVLGDKDVRCTKNEYNLIQEEQTYRVSFDWNKLRPNVGQLETIKFTKKRLNE